MISWLHTSAKYLKLNMIYHNWCMMWWEIRNPFTNFSQTAALLGTNWQLNSRSLLQSSISPPHTSFYCHWKEGQMSSVWIFEEESFDQTFCCIQCSSLPVLWLQTKFEPGIWKANTEGAWHDHWVHRSSALKQGSVKLFLISWKTSEVLEIFMTSWGYQSDYQPQAALGVRLGISHKALTGI